MYVYIIEIENIFTCDYIFIDNNFNIRIIILLLIILQSKIFWIQKPMDQANQKLKISIFLSIAYVDTNFCTS